MKSKIAAAAVSAVLVCTAACSEGSVVGFAPTEQDKQVVMTVGGMDVAYQEFRYYYLNNKRDSFDAEAVPTDTEHSELLAMTEQNAKQRYALILFAEQYGVSVTSDDKKAANEYVDSYINDYFATDDDYMLALESQYMTDSLFRSFQSEIELAYRVLDKMKEAGEIITSDEDIDAVFASDEIICLKEIFVPYTSEGTKESAKAYAEEALSKLMDGEEFEALMPQYSDYSTETLSPEHGYYTMKYDAMDVIWNVATDLAVGEHSYVIESEYGFHLIKRCEKDPEYMEENRDTIYEAYTQAKFEELIAPFMESLTVEYTDYGKSLRATDII